ncbi:hypothetical protein F5888DRAFT_1112222 [Russula emetica]|nr:hypothetical protein F5888DRAFT_1112222 [Russula emetica]
MSSATTGALPLHPVISHKNLLFDYPDADVILRSLDSYEFRVLKMYIARSSPILGEKVLTSISPKPQPESTPTIPAGPDVEDAAANTLCVVQLPIEGAILFSLLTYIFPVPPILPSTVEQVMELLSFAQLNKMDIVLTHIRNHIAQREPPLIRKETAFFIYSFSLRHYLRPEALQAARCTLSFASLIIEDLAKENVLDTMPGAFLHELWNYHQRVRSNLSLDLKEFKKSDALTILGDSTCESTDSSIPSWLESYISTIGTDRVPASLNLRVADFYMALAEHVKMRTARWIVFRGWRVFRVCASCSRIPRESIHKLWRALTAVVRSSISKAESDFAFPIEGTWPEGPTRKAASPPKYSNMLNADVILQSSDLVNFRVRRSVLATSSPFFSHIFSFPQPSNGTAPDKLPVVGVSENAVVLNSLISMLYPVPPEMPNSSDDSLALVAAAAKYKMDTVRSSIREEISRKKLFS